MTKVPGVDLYFISITALPLINEDTAGICYPVDLHVIIAAQSGAHAIWDIVVVVLLAAVIHSERVLYGGWFCSIAAYNWDSQCKGGDEN